MATPPQTQTTGGAQEASVKEKRVRTLDTMNWQSLPRGENPKWTNKKIADTLKENKANQRHIAAPYYARKNGYLYFDIAGEVLTMKDAEETN